MPSSFVTEAPLREKTPAGCCIFCDCEGFDRG